MPRKKIVAKQRKITERLTEDSAYFLSHGFVLDGITGPTEAQAEKLWKTHKVRLISDFCKRRPGSMPWAWWRYDAPAEAAHDDRERGFFGYRKGDESEHNCLIRLGVLDLAKALGYQEPEPLSENVIDFDIHKAFR